MKAFIDRDFLLTTDTAKHLYHDYAEPMPIIDYHCHLVPQEIYEDRKFENITQVWLGADHYKWRLMRSAGVDEKYVTGDATDREKFQKWAETIGLAIGNPLYHWSHLELRNYFGYEGALNGDTAEEVWNLCNAKLQEPGMSARNLIINSNVKALCTTDDPADTLEWHRKLAEEGFSVKVLPSYRPDKAVALEKPDYLDYLLWPRTVALAELAWHYGPKDWPAFKERLVREHYPRLQAMGIRFRLFPPKVSWCEGTLSATVEDGSTLYWSREPFTEEHLYEGPISTSEPQHYRFISRLRSARSPWVAHPSHYKTITPALRFESSMPESERAPFARLESHKGAAWTLRTHREGDWMQFTFEEPLHCREILLQTGYLHLPRCIVRGSRVELHYTDGRVVDFGSLVAGKLILRPEHPVRAIRLVATATGNGEERVIIQPLKIKR